MDINLSKAMADMKQKSMSLKYEPTSEPLHVYVNPNPSTRMQDLGVDINLSKAMAPMGRADSTFPVTRRKLIGH